MTNFLFFSAFVVLAYLTTRLSARQPRRVPVRVRSGRPVDPRRN